MRIIQDESPPGCFSTYSPYPWSLSSFRVHYATVLWVNAVTGVMHRCDLRHPMGQELPFFREDLPVQPVDATPPDINIFLKGGVHDAKTMEAVFGPAGRYGESLESRRVVKCDWTSTGQG